SEYSGRVALQQNGVRSQVAKGAPHAANNPAREIGQALARLHEAELDVRLQPEHVERLVEHMPVLPSRDQARLQQRTPCQGRIHRFHLDDLRSRAGDNGDGFNGHTRVRAISPRWATRSVQRAFGSSNSAAFWPRSG